MSKTKDDFKNEITQTIIPGVQKVLSDVLGQKIEIEVQWDSLDKVKYVDRAYEALSTWNGYFVLGRVADAIKFIAEEYYCKGTLAQKIKKIFVVSDSERTLKYKEGVLIVLVDLSLGSFGTIDGEKLKAEILRVFDLASGGLKKAILEDAIPASQEELKKYIGSSVPIEVEWKTIEGNPKEIQILSHLSYWHGYYTFKYIAYAYKYAVENKKITKQEIANLVKKIIVYHTPGYWSRRKIMLDDEGTLHLTGAFESWWGFPDYYRIAEVISWEIHLRKLEKTVEQNGFLDTTLHEELIEIIKSIARSDTVSSGDITFLQRALKRKCFLQPDKADSIALQEFMKKYVNPKDEKKEKKDEPPKPEEIFVHGWSIKKTNHRGQVQDRLLCITNEALYTFSWNYAKKEAIKKRIHRYSWDCYYSMYMGVLQAQSSGGNVPGVGGALTAVAKAGAKLLATQKFGLMFRTTLPTKKTDLVQMAISKAVKPHIYKIFKFLIDNQIQKVGTLVKDIKGLPNYTQPTEFLDCVGKYLASIGNLPQVTVDERLPATSLLDIVTALQENFNLMQNQPQLVIPNLPSLELYSVLHYIVDQLEQIKELTIDIPKDVSVAVFVQKAAKEFKQLKTPPAFNFPAIKDIPFTDFINILKDGVSKAESKPKLEIHGICAFPSLDAVFQALAGLKNVPDVKLPPYPALKFSDVFESSSLAMSKLGISPKSLVDLELPGLSLKKLLPNFNLPIPNIPIISQLKTPPMPSTWEFIAEPVLEKDHVKDQQNLKWYVWQICWAIYGACSAGNSPNYQWQPWETSSITVPSCYLSMVYNATGGKTKKVVPEGAETKNEEKEKMK